MRLLHILAPGGMDQHANAARAVQIELREGRQSDQHQRQRQQRRFPQLDFAHHFLTFLFFERFESRPLFLRYLTSRKISNTSSMGMATSGVTISESIMYASALT